MLPPLRNNALEPVSYKQLSDHEPDHLLESSALQPISYVDKPLLKLYFWKKRGLLDCYVTELSLGHVALDIKVPLNWYRHRIFKQKPVITEDFPPSYNLYEDAQNNFHVLVVHTAQVNESLNLSEMADSNDYLYDLEISSFLTQHLHSEASSEDVSFPLKLLEWIARSCQYRHDEEYFYLSFSPENSVVTGNQLLKTLGKCLSRDSEWENEGCPDETTVVDNLNHEELYVNALQLRYRIEQSHSSVSADAFADLIQWGIWRGQTCSSLIVSLLSDNKIGATARVPAFGRLGTLQSLILLSLRPVFALSVLYPLCCELILDNSTLFDKHRHRWHSGNHAADHSSDLEDDSVDTHTLLVASSLVFLSVGVLSGVEKVMAVCFPFLKKTAYRQRELVEIRPFADFMVQWIGFSSVPLLSLWWNFQVFERYVDGNTEGLIILDALASFIIGVSVYLVSTYLTSRLLYFLQHGCFQTPTFALEMVNFIKETKEIPKELLEWQFKKEWALNIMTGLSLLANTVTLRYATSIEDDFDDQYVFLGGTAALFLSGYAFTKGLVSYFDRQQMLEKAALEKRKPVGELALEQLRSHDPKPELFFLITFLGGTLMLIAAERLPNNWPFEAALLMTTLIGVFAYAGSLLFYHVGIRVREAVRASSWRCSLFSSTIDGEDEETNRLCTQQSAFSDP